MQPDLLVRRAADQAERAMARGQATWEHLDRDRIREVGLDLEQPQRIAEPEDGAMEHLIAGRERPYRRGHLDLTTRAHRRRRVLGDVEGGAGEDARAQDAQRAGAVIPEREVQRERAVDGERSAGLIAGRHPPRQLDLLATKQDRRREECDVRREQRGDHD